MKGSPPAAAPDDDPRDPLAPIKRRLHDALMRRVSGRGVEALHPAARRLLIREEALAVLREEGHLLPQEALARVVNEVSDRVVGLGPIESLLRDPEVSEGLLPKRVPDAPPCLGVFAVRSPAVALA
jgi:hypothetical protein